MNITLTDTQIWNLLEIIEKNKESFLDECRGFLLGESLKTQVEKLIQEAEGGDSDKSFTTDEYLQFLEK